MKNLLRYCGMLGMVIMAFGIVSTVIDLSQKGTLSAFSTGHLTVGMALMLTWLVIFASSLKSMVRSKSTKQGANSMVMIGLVAVIIAAANVILLTRPNLSKSWDFTEQGVFSLADQTVKTLKGLSSDVKIVSFFAAGAKERELMKDLVTRYRGVTSKIVEENYDADENPQLAKELEATNGVVVVQSGKSKTKIKDISEQEVTNAIIQITKSDNKTLYFLKGHEEGDLASEEGTGYAYLKKYIENEGYAVKDLFLNKEESVPTDCKVLVVLAPKTRFLDDEIKKLEIYLDQGGHAMFISGAEYNQDLSGLVDIGLNPLFEKWGFSQRQDIIFYEQPIPAALKQMFGRQVMPAATFDSYGDHAIVKDFKARMTMPYARSIAKTPELPAGVTLHELMVANDASFWGETNIKSVTERTLDVDAADTKVPLITTIMATKKIEADKKKYHDEAALMLVSSSAWAANKQIPDSSAPDFFLNSANWMAGEAAKISIRPRQIKASKLSWTTEEANVIFYASVLTLPELILLFGLGIWQWRRRR